MVNSGVEPSSKPLPVSLIEAVVADIDIVVVMLVKRHARQTWLGRQEVFVSGEFKDKADS